MNVLLRSIDLDGCVFNQNYDELIREYNKYSPKRLLIANEYFIQEENKRDNFDAKYTLIGSNRQSEHIDQINRQNNRTGTFTVQSRVLNDALTGTILLPFLMADVDNNLPIGTSFGYSNNSSVKVEHGNHWMFDESKVRLLYAQMHYMALMHPDDEITFDFYDDNETILDLLYTFYAKNEDLIPCNVSLTLRQYEGKVFKDVDGKQCYTKDKKTIKGTGFIDKNYQQTAIDLAHLAADKENVEKDLLAQGIGSVNVALHADPALLRNRKSLIDVEDNDSDNDSGFGDFDCSNDFKYLTRQEFKTILDAYQSTNWIYKYFLCYFGLKGSATMTALYHLLDDPKKETFTQHDVCAKITNSGDRLYRERIQYVRKEIESINSKNSTGTDDVLTKLRDKFQPVSGKIDEKGALNYVEEDKTTHVENNRKILPNWSMVSTFYNFFCFCHDKKQADDTITVSQCNGEQRNSNYQSTN